MTLARKLGTTEHLSCFRQIARRHGLLTAQDLVDEAVARGCFHYMRTHEPPPQRVSEKDFSNEQLALALLSIANAYDPWQIRVGVMMLSANGNNPIKLARYAVYERSESVIRSIALSGVRYEPHNEFWKQLLAALPKCGDLREDVLPHHTRFVSMPGLIGPGKMGSSVWLRPRKIKSLGYAG